MLILRAGICNENSRKGGFTLLELIVVIFIISLIMGLVIPSFHGVGDGRLRSEAGKMASLLRYLNDGAISRKETFPFRLNLDTKFVSWNTPEGERSEKFDSLFNVSTTSTGDVSRGEVTLFFSPSGLQENMVIILKDSKEEMSVSFNPLSGRTKITQKSK